MLVTQRTVISVLNKDDAALLLAYFNENKAHLAPWEPRREDSYYSLEHVQNLITHYQLALKQHSALHFAAFNQAHTEILALCSFTNVVYGPFQACHLGYSVAQKYQGQGVMREVLSSSLDYVFRELKLNRVMANYMPHNDKSAKLLSCLGFAREGLAKRYLKIAGQWRDHVLTAKINPYFDVE